MTTRMIPLDQIRFGHEADPPINARRVGRDDGIAELAASIGAHGLQTALKVKEGHDARGVVGIFVGIGNRRLAAMRLLVEQSQMAADDPVECGEFDATVDAREAALAEQINRAALHPADEYEEFRALADTGMSEKSIASRFGREPKHVARMLALGRLSPVILDWWRGQEPSRNVTDAVKAFTLAPSIAEQERVFKKLKNHLWGHDIRHEFGAGDRTIGKQLDFVGKDAYLAAGGTVVEDLFEGDHAVSDPALVKKLVAERLQAKVDELLADGWSWAALADDMPGGWSWSWEKLPVNKKASKADKAKAGAVVKLSDEGKLEITYGVVKPAAQKPAAAKDSDEPKEKAAKTISDALHQRLSAQATLATRAALKQEPRIGLVALLAGFMAHRHLHTDSPVRVYHDGFGKRQGDDKVSFAEAFKRFSSMSDTELFQIAAACAGEAVHMERGHNGRPPFDRDASILATTIDAEHLTAALHKTFDAEDYFSAASKPFVIAAIREAINEDEARKADKLKKKELVEFAVKNIVGTGWLPRELRAPTYSGPGEMPAIATAPPIEDDPDENAHLDDPDFDEIDEEDEDEAA
ncbi:hypothetical protein [Mesorhizobium sp. B2-4-6]|uniref:ParB/RepB/Spo0J family partition protein n=1 Tax=Mesorhizobium sp. B2-4-6 TaxID=2589943 RepID=UPI00112CD2F2|nr:hypothetical protein [Mesorhizobium sp. B2-4-6]TPL40672.1 hypothetical protein FJ957_25925 [Mesorhizobium sp. B2-4-6]